LFPGILAPFKSTQYYPNKFSARKKPEKAKELFNLKLSSLRVTIKRHSLL
jgi:hypothetical protein